MIDTSAIISAAIVCLAGVTSPGPNFVALAHRAVSSSRPEAIVMVAGIALINMLWASMALFGLTLLISMLPWLFWAIKVAGGTYLVWFGVQLLRRSNEPLQARGATTASGLALKVALRDGIATNLSNPKSMAFYASVFSGAVPKDSTPETLMAMVAMVGIVSTLWYGTVALALSVERMADMFRKGKWVIERCCGIFLILLGVRQGLF